MLLVRPTSRFLPEYSDVNALKGYTVLDNVFIYDGGVYLVTDHTKDFPPMPAIVSSTGLGFGKWSLLSRRQAATQFGQFGGVIRGVSWMAADFTPHNSTLLALWRTYSSLDPSIDSLGHTHLAPSHQLILPYHRFFTDEDPPFDQDTVRHRRVDTGFHPYLAKAAFPHLIAMYFQDFEDYTQKRVPFMFERLIVAERESVSRVVDDVDPEFLIAFEARNSSEASIYPALL
ncbi:hypothetical protein AN958_05820 [Leucoagaricus sp. SymC.cos]|nr:hypothetical protein AN958_05820 [Leucoagaricus sp. SymC.cos]